MKEKTEMRDLNEIPIGNNANRTKRKPLYMNKKPQMLNSDELTDEEIQKKVRQWERYQRQHQQVTQAYNKRFSMFRTKKLGVTYLILGAIGAVAIIHVMNIILGFPSPIPF